jgi:hypothetical protein
MLLPLNTIDEFLISIFIGEPGKTHHAEVFWRILILRHETVQSSFACPTGLEPYPIS